MKATALPTNDLSFGTYPQRVRKTGRTPGAAIFRWVKSKWSATRFTPKHIVDLLVREREFVKALNDVDLSQRTLKVGAVMRSKGASDQQCAMAIAVTAEVMTRSIGTNPYVPQMVAAYQLLRGNLVEMKTGEGKTLAVALAAAVAANAGSSVFVLTANDYLINRDYEQLKKFYDAMTLSVGQVASVTDAVQRKLNWRQQIVYSSAREMAFDYLRDHLQSSGHRNTLTQRARALTSTALDSVSESENERSTGSLVPGLCFCIVDEADSLLLDEATMPLIIADQAGTLDGPGYKKAYQLAAGLSQAQHFRIDRISRRVTLTSAGVTRVEGELTEECGDLALLRRAIELVETALAAQYLFLIGRDYAILDQSLVLIDELTGRVASGRQWQGALNAMVQIKEGLEPTPPSRATAQITYLDLFPRFMHLCGTSGTLRDARRELLALYGLTVSEVALVNPSRLGDNGTQVQLTAANKWNAVINSVAKMIERNRPVLIGTASVQDSTHLSGLLSKKGIRHQVLNATQCAQEADHLLRAGRARVVTVATNIAGRGTDIKLSEVARRNGGLHVILTMRNRSRRIDRQLSGRAGRQGDPGSYQCIVSLEDRLIQDALAVSVISFVKSIFQLVDGRGQILWQTIFSLSQRIEQSRDYFTRAALQSASKRRHRQFSFIGGPE